MSIDPSEAFAQNRSFYDKNASDYCRATETVDMRSYYERFNKYVPKCGKLLDAGCGCGRDSLIFSRTFGFDVTSIDASEEMVRQACSRGVSAQKLPLQNITWIELFDAIWASAVLLHIPHIQISNVLGRMRSALKPNGVMFISLKYGGGEIISDDGRFFSYFSEVEFRSTLSTAGFTILEDWWPKCGDGPRPWMQFIVRRT